MKKGYYIYVENCGSLGVKRKIKMQIKAFARQFEIKEVIIENLDRNLGQRIAGLFFWNSIVRKYEAALKKIENPSSTSRLKSLTASKPFGYTLQMFFNDKLAIGLTS